MDDASCPPAVDPPPSLAVTSPTYRKTVAIGFLGTNLDAGRSASRWDRWRPTVALAQHEALTVDRLEVLYEPSFVELMDQVVEDISHVAPDLEVCPVEISLGDPWDFEQVYAVLHDFARSYDFRDEEDYLVHITTGTHVAQICMFLLTESRRLPGRLVQTSPPRPRKDGGPGSFAIIDLDLGRYDLIARRFAEEQQEGTAFLKAGIDTRNAAFNRLIDRIEEVAVASPDPILLMGPTGAGKSQLARRVYELKKHRRQVAGELVEVNCATLRGDQAMAALFGHTRGAFTGAQKDRPGLLKRADGGLLFLDEIGELGLDEQAMLLRALEVKTFLPVGSDREVKSDFQLIAGTNRSLSERVREGQFREDLLARINLWTFALPALADRREDIEPNLAFELERVSGRLGRHVTFNAEARRRFLAFSDGAPWPGNFRDFAAAITRMATLARGGRIDASTVDEEIERLEASWTGTATPSEGLVEAVLGAEAAAVDPFDRAQLEEVFRTCKAHGTLSEAGRALFVHSRQRRKSTNDADRLRKFLARWGVDFAAVKEALEC